MILITFGFTFDTLEGLQYLGTPHFLVVKICTTRGLKQENNTMSTFDKVIAHNVQYMLTMLVWKVKYVHATK